jgi:hypothetical protein
VVADTLSRVESITAPPSYDAIAASQDSDDELRALLASNTALQLEKHLIPGTALSIYCDTSTGKPRPYVPAPLRLQVFQSVHDLSHPGTKSTSCCIATDICRLSLMWEVPTHPNNPILPNASDRIPHGPIHILLFVPCLSWKPLICDYGILI